MHSVSSNSLCFSDTQIVPFLAIRSPFMGAPVFHGGTNCFRLIYVFLPQTKNSHSSKECWFWKGVEYASPRFWAESN